jgi:hypothetical protein
MIRALGFSACIVVMLLSAACSREPGSPVLPTPSAPAPAITNYAGSWHGNFVLTQCDGQRHCNLTMGREYSFSLLLQQTGARVDGALHVSGFPIPVEGDVSADGRLTLTGRRASAGLYSPHMELTRFEAQRSHTAGIVAEFSYVVQYPEGSPLAPDSRQQLIGGSIASAALGDRTPRSSFAGRWRGRLFITDCIWEGTLGCYPEVRGEEPGYELTLTQTGDRVEGELWTRERIKVTGTVSGDTLTLDVATLQQPVSSATSLWHLRSWTMTKDAIGQVRGSMAFDRETVWVPPANMPTNWARYRAEIVYGVLAP